MNEMPTPEMESTIMNHVQPKAVERRKSYVTADGVLHFFTSENQEIKIPVRAKTRIFRQMQDMETFDSLFFLLESIGDKPLIEKIEELDIAETAELVAQWGEEFEKRIQKALNRKALSAGE